MAKQVINLGTMADNKSGDPLRIAFTKINENFDELYSADSQPTVIPTAISSGDTAPGSAVVANTDSVDVNFAMIGTKFKFKDNGDLQLNGGGLVDQDGNSLLNQGGGYQATFYDINGDWHQGSPNTFSLDDYVYDIVNFNQNGAHTSLTVTLPSNPNHGKMQTIKYSGMANPSVVCNIVANQNIENNGQQTITISKNNGYVTFIWDADWSTWWIISKDLADSKVTNNDFSDTTIELDLTATINKIVPKASGGVHYHLADGYEGQIMYIACATGGETSSEYTVIQIDNVRSTNSNGIINQGQGWWWLPFRMLTSSSLMLIFVDGAWNVPHNAFD